MFEKFKRSLQEKIEKNAVKVDLSWSDSDGIRHTEEVILKRSRLPLVGDWGRIYPPLNEDGSVNLINAFLGGKKNFVRLLLLLGLVALAFLAVNEIFTYIEVLTSDPCVQACINPVGNILA